MCLWTYSLRPSATKPFVSIPWQDPLSFPRISDALPVRLLLPSLFPRQENLFFSIVLLLDVKYQYDLSLKSEEVQIHTLPTCNAFLPVCYLFPSFLCLDTIPVLKAMPSCLYSRISKSLLSPHFHSWSFQRPQINDSTIQIIHNN